MLKERSLPDEMVDAILETADDQSDQLEFEDEYNVSPSFVSLW